MLPWSHGYPWNRVFTKVLLFSTSFGFYNNWGQFIIYFLKRFIMQIFTFNPPYLFAVILIVLEVELRVHFSHEHYSNSFYSNLKPLTSLGDRNKLIENPFYIKIFPLSGTSVFFFYPLVLSCVYVASPTCLTGGEDELLLWRVLRHSPRNPFLHPFIFS